MEIAARERIAEQHLVVARIEKRRPGGRQPSARDAAQDHRHGFDGPLHLDVGFAFDGVASSCQTRGHAPRRALLSTGPRELVTTDLEAVVRRAHRQMIRREAVGVLLREDPEAELEPFEGDRWLGAIEAELHEAAAARRDVRRRSSTSAAESRQSMPAAKRRCRRSSHRRLPRRLPSATCACRAGGSAVLARCRAARDPTSTLFVVQRHERIHSRRAARRQVRGKARHHQHHERGRNERQGVGGGKPEEQSGTNRPAASAAARPTTMPRSTSVIDSLITRRSTWRLSAPSAMRMPISFVRRATLYDISPKRPIEAMSMASPPNIA